MRIFSTFSGIGGFEIGIQAAYSRVESEREKAVGVRSTGLEGEGQDNTGTRLPLRERSNRDTRDSARPLCVGYSEIDKYASSVYEYHFKGAENHGDITKINAEELPDFDCLVGGFPCQAFSIAGKRRGFEDTRGTLFFDLARILEAKRPMYGVLENVKGLVNHDKGQTLDVILERLQELGYYCNWEIYNSKDFGVPQNRERVYLVCQNLRGLTNIGQSETMTSSERLIQSYLFQLLLNNLNEVKKLQEHESKDSVLSYLILREINQSQKTSQSESTSAGTMTATGESTSQLKAEGRWQNIAILLSKELDVDLNEPNKSTISTAIKKITPSTTYTFSQMQNLIWLAIVVLRQSQKSLWSEVLSDLTVIQEGTKYARINHKTEEAIVTESGTVHLSHVYQDQHDKFIKRHLRGTPRPEVFPITTDDGEDTQSDKGRSTELFPTIRATHYKNGDNQPLISKTVRSGGRSSPHGSKQNWDSYEVEGTIRRLTPTETERLQGFPDSWTKYGLLPNGKEVLISDSQRYKMCGNAVTTNVVQAVFEKILSSYEL